MSANAPRGFNDVTGPSRALRALGSAYEAGLLNQLGPFAQGRFDRFRLIGMGQSFIAADAVAARMRSLGLNAGAEMASSTYGYPSDPKTLTIAVSASGRTPEVVAALDRLDGHFPVLAVTNDLNSDVAKRAGAVLPLLAGRDADSLAASGFTHSALVLHSLAVVWSGGIPDMVARDQMALIDKVNSAWNSLHADHSNWLNAAVEAISPSSAVAVLAPAEVIGSAHRSAFALRRNAGRHANAYDTADWPHSGSLATGNPPAAIVYTGSRCDAAVVAKLGAAGTRVVLVGSGAAAASEAMPAGNRAVIVRHDLDDEVRVQQFAQARVAEMIAATIPLPA